MDGSWSSWSDEQQSNRQDLEKYEYKLAEQYAPGDNLNEDLLAAYEKQPECDEWNSYFVKWMRFVLENNGKIEIEKVEEWVMQQPWQVRLWLWKRGFLVRNKKKKEKKGNTIICSTYWDEVGHVWRAVAYRMEKNSEPKEAVQNVKYGTSEDEDKQKAIDDAIKALLED